MTADLNGKARETEITNYPEKADGSKQIRKKITPLLLLNFSPIFAINLCKSFRVTRSKSKLQNVLE